MSQLFIITNRQINAIFRRIILLLIAFWAALFILVFPACTAQHRLATLIAHHPELKSDTNIVRSQTLILPNEQVEIYITPEQIATMQTAAAAPTDDLENNEKRTSVVVAHAAAALEADGRGGFRLSARQIPDTIVKIDTIAVPKFITTTQTKTVVEHRMNRFQQCFFATGIGYILLLFGYIIFKILKRFYRR